MEKEFTLKIKLTTMDMYRFLMRHAYTNFSGLFGLAISALAMLGLILNVAEKDTTKQVLLVIAALLFTVINPLSLYFKAKKQLLLNPFFKEAITYHFDEEGLTVSQGEEASTILWKDMKKVIEGKKLIILYITSVVAYVFPKSQCKEEKELLTFIRSHLMGGIK